MFLNQTFELQDLLYVALLIVLEGLLSLDNALVLGVLARKLPKHLQKRALTYGLVGAFVFRLIAIGLATYLFHWKWVKLAGGAYLVLVALKHFVTEARKKDDRKIVMGPDGEPMAVSRSTGQPLPENGSGHGAVGEAALTTHTRAFWSAVVAIEFTDIAFAVDSILAAVALVTGASVAGEMEEFHPKLWVVFVGGMLGVVMMRFAAIIFIRLLEKFPRFEISAYLLVAVIGAKLVLDWGVSEQYLPAAINFHNVQGLAFWVFWTVMAACFALGFVPERREAKSRA